MLSCTMPSAHATKCHRPQHSINNTNLSCIYYSIWKTSSSCSSCRQWWVLAWCLAEAAALWTDVTGAECDSFWHKTAPEAICVAFWSFHWGSSVAPGDHRDGKNRCLRYRCPLHLHPLLCRCLRAILAHPDWRTAEQPSLCFSPFSVSSRILTRSHSPLTRLTYILLHVRNQRLLKIPAPVQAPRCSTDLTSCDQSLHRADFIWDLELWWMDLHANAVALLIIEEQQKRICSLY